MIVLSILVLWSAKSTSTGCFQMKQISCLHIDCILRAQVDEIAILESD